MPNYHIFYMNITLSEQWQCALSDHLESASFASLMQFVDDEYNNYEVFPPRESIFQSLNLCPIDQVKVVIIGQDPYHDVGQANGLCFSVADGIKIPPSLVNIFKEIESDLAIAPPTSGNLERWAQQGVLMLNAVLTVRAHQAASHSKKGWERFTDSVVKAVAEHHDGVVYMLWGKYAQKKCAVVDPSRNEILESVHPSPLSVYRGFYGCGHFSKANAYLEAQGQKPIAW